MSELETEKPMESRRYYRRRRPSFFGPIVLIAIGVFFLLYNLDMLPEGSPNWVALLQLWPLWLIFLGANIIVRQAPGAFGSLLSALVGILAVVVFGYVLFFAEDSTLLNRLRVAGNVEFKTETIEYGPGDVSTADVFIDFSSPSADVYALDDSNNLIEGTVSYTGDVDFRTSVSGGRANIRLATTSTNNDWTFFINPSNWAGLGENDETRWQIGLNPSVETDLEMDVGSGRVDLDLSDLTLSSLRLDGGSGRVDLSLPDGDYDVSYDAGSGSTRMSLSSDGRQTIDVSGGSGSMTFYLPDSMEARINVNGGSGGFNIDRNRFSQVSGSERDEGAWETSGYDDASDRVTLNLDVGSGSVTIREP